MQSPDLSSEFVTLIGRVRSSLRDKEGISGPDLDAALRKARRRLPRRIWRLGRRLSKVEPMVAHPKLVMTLDHAALRKAGAEVLSYLDGIDVADRRKGWWLGLLGSLVFNLLLFGALMIALLKARGLI